MSGKNYKILTNQYFEAFVNKDILSLSELYSKNINELLVSSKL